MRGKNMTVKELIEELKCYEENSRVWIAINERVERVTKVDQTEITMNDDIIIH